MWHKYTKLRLLVVLISSLTGLAHSSARADCATEQVACSNRCLENNDTACIHTCGDRALACFQKFADQNGAGKEMDEMLNHVPSGSYASWSEDDKRHAASALTNICDRRCRNYTVAAEQGSMRASYEAAACTTACFVNNLPSDYPRIEEYKQAARQNYKAAKDLGSNAPVFLSH